MTLVQKIFNTRIYKKYCRKELTMTRRRLFFEKHSVAIFEVHKKLDTVLTLICTLFTGHLLRRVFLCVTVIPRSNVGI